MNLQGDAKFMRVDPGIVSAHEVYAIILQDRSRVEFRYGMRFFPTFQAIEEWIKATNEGGWGFLLCRA